MMHPITDMFWGKLSRMLHCYRNRSTFMLISTRKHGPRVFSLKAKNPKQP